MTRFLRDVPVRSGERMRVSLVTPPAEEYGESLIHFLEHKGDRTLRGIRQRLQGTYADSCDDRFFVGEIEGKIAGQLWYGFPRNGSGIANFGEVYTEPKHRRKGITTLLMEDFAKDFAASPARAAFCNCGRLHVARIYMKHGFSYALPDNAFGALALIKGGAGAPGEFLQFEEDYYRFDGPLSVGLGSMVHRHDVDKLLKLAFQMREGCPQRLGAGAPIESYADALFLMEDGRGIVTVATTTHNHVAGWGFFLSTGASSEQCAFVFDYELHHNYQANALELVTAWLRIAREQEIRHVFAYSAETDEHRLEILESAGFRTCARLPQACMSDGSPVAEIVHVWSPS